MERFILISGNLLPFEAVSVPVNGFTRLSTTVIEDVAALPVKLYSTFNSMPGDITMTSLMPNTDFDPALPTILTR